MPLLIVHANSLSIAGDTVASKDLFLFTYTKLHGLPPKVRGVLGEGYLRNFDVLIDYRHQVIQLESGLGSMAKTLKGEHLPVQLSGTVRGEPTHGRLIVTGHIRELGDNSMYLVLTPVPTTSPSFGKNWVLAQSGRRSWTPVSDHRASPR